MILNKKTFIKNPLQTPPNTVDVFLIHSPVGLIHINPVAHARSHAFKFIYVAKHGFFASSVELSNAVLFDVLLSGET